MHKKHKLRVLNQVQLMTRKWARGKKVNFPEVKVCQDGYRYYK